ncbi:hypothetical protein HS088_TW18G00468 [Tripterygium wilfordii]|uniref:Uncharacterized protein n=1 Tax=Tripterygium wilfordii TaxID=458696 RepID=A0A7J7CCC4_TRIWF|nr:hypothetical protein HS088_TW18G00468 [Tripterygium wilfordii]
MEVLNAAGLTPLSVFCERRTEPTKSLQSLKLSKSPSISTTTPTLQDHFSRTLHGSLVLMSSVLASGLAKALTYEEALGQSVRTPTSDFDASGVLENLFSFGTDNPVIIGGGVAAVLAAPLVFSQILKKPKPWGVESAKNAYAKLADESTALLLDIRAPAEFRQVGSSDIRGLGKKLVSIAYKGEDKPGFLKKLSLKFNAPENNIFFILDK